MEIGAVKQAFNNEVILLKKNLQQAKIQIIHKLTRKAKTLSEKKGPESLNEKFKRKAELAVKEVLVIKKIKARDVARFIVTHTGELKEYLNKPAVDENKACARLLLHKSMTNKYNIIRKKFANISIHDLLMSRQERRKLKKEAREKQKEKKNKQKQNPNNTGGVWDVEVSDNSKVTLEPDTKDENESPDENYMPESNSEYDKDEEGVPNILKVRHTLLKFDKNVCDDDFLLDGKKVSKILEIPSKKKKLKDRVKINEKSMVTDENVSGSLKKLKEKHPQINHRNNKKVKEDASKMIVESNALTNGNEILNKIKQTKDKHIPSSINLSEPSIPILNNSYIVNSKKLDKKVKEGNKNKNLKEKLMKRNFNKKVDEETLEPSMVADPFFVTSTGENYMSLVEPRPPDELKDEHKTGNRKYRRAVMFGHVPRVKPRKSVFNDSKQFHNDNNQFIKPTSKFNQDKKIINKDRQERITESSVAEKLHPSWEAKKRQSSILPFKGKKITFDDA